jgi:hypothetical protein
MEIPPEDLMLFASVLLGVPPKWISVDEATKPCPKES